MRLRIGAFVGAVSIFSLSAQDFETSQLSSDPIEAARQMQQQAQFQFENQMVELDRNANATKEPLIQQRNSLNTAIQDCFIQRNEKSLQAQEQADQREQQATNQMIQSVPQALTPLVQSAGAANNQGKAAAASQREGAIADQNAAVDRMNLACRSSPASVAIINSFVNGVRLSDPSRASSVVRNVQSLSQQLSSATAVDPTHNAGAACAAQAQNLVTITNSARREIEESKKADGATTQNLIAGAMAAATLGINYYGYQNEKKAAEKSLDNANEMNDMSYDACKDGILAQAKELDRQLANIDAQLAADKDRLARQFAQFKVTVPANLVTKPLLNVDGDGEDTLPILGGAGNAVAAANFGGPNKTLDAFQNPNGGGGGGPGAGGGGAPSAGGEGGKVPWGFRDPYEPNNSGSMVGLPNQGDAAQKVAGAGEDFGGGGPQGTDPFGPGFLGFDDAFANAKDGAALLKAAEGNGFWELAMRTRRRVYAHLGELLGKPGGPKMGSKKDPDRKISSIRE